MRVNVEIIKSWTHLLGVAREAVEDAARGCGLEEEHGRGEHRGAQPAVQG